MIEQIRDIEDIPFFLLGIFLKKNGNLESTVVTLIFFFFFHEKRDFFYCVFGVYLFIYFFIELSGFVFERKRFIYLFKYGWYGQKNR